MHGVLCPGPRAGAQDLGPGMWGPEPGALGPGAWPPGANLIPLFPRNEMPLNQVVVSQRHINLQIRVLSPHIAFDFNTGPMAGAISS